MSQIWFKIEGFYVNVSSHGYMQIWAKGVPALKFSDLSPIVDLPVNKLGKPIEYNNDYDDVSVPLDSVILKNRVFKFVRMHKKNLLISSKVRKEDYEKRKKQLKYEHPKIGTIRVGDELLLWKKKEKVLWISGEYKEAILYCENKSRIGSFRADHPDLKRFDESNDY